MGFSFFIITFVPFGCVKKYRSKAINENRQIAIIFYGINGFSEKEYWEDEE